MFVYLWGVEAQNWTINLINFLSFFEFLYFLHFPAPCYIPAMSKNMPKTGKNSGCPPGQTPNTEATTSAYAASEALRP